VVTGENGAAGGIVSKAAPTVRKGRLASSSGDQYRTSRPRKQDRPQVHKHRARDQQQRYPCPLEQDLQQPTRGPLCRLVQGCAGLRMLEMVGLGSRSPTISDPSNLTREFHLKPL
jgi:hypothetical protein